MKYLITGGYGFLGSNLAAKLISKNETVLLYDNLSRVGSNLNLKWLEGIGVFKFAQASTLDYNQLSQTIEAFNPDIIFHFAGQVAMTTSIANPRLDFETNTLGAFNLLEAVRQYAPKAGVIYSSTNKVYGDLEQYAYTEDKTRYNCKECPNGFDENTQLEFHSPYGCSKGAADQYILDYSRIFKINTAVFRHSSMYGSRQFGTFDQGWVSWFCQQAIMTKNDPKTEFTISGSGKQVRDLLHADDMVALYKTAADNIAKINGQVFNIGGGIENSMSLLELFSLLESELKIKLNYQKLAPRESDQKFFVADITKAKKLLNWTPKVDKITGIKNMLSWLEQNIN
ncbi:MAG: GDP-mannose 4,6-dehydratase [Elusimicrobiota bacterium]|jgi:CDP-paratose 2-epimerase|nr:GDP-mannose 4,6-dehydratase [Elusimicrobiota bacterium]